MTVVRVIDIFEDPEGWFRQVREEYACHAQKGIDAYRRERRYCLFNIRQLRRVQGVQKSLYHQHALAGLRQLGI